ncbi:Copper chaperone PCu(A)C OS=Castellaniella defragrans OX=75697 GN=HNR28_002649 PE=4 SV=1 [Castellaniella defragrans]
MRMRTLGVWMVSGLCLAAGAWAHGTHGSDGASGPMAKEVSASACWIRQLPAPVPSGGFLVIHNAGSAPVVLKSVHSADYGQAMMHQTKESGGMSTMSMVHDLSVPAGGDLAFEPGHYHLMLEQPRAGLKVGDTVQMQFVLADGRQFSAACEVKPASALSAGPAPAASSMSGMSGMADHGHMAH